MGQGTLACRVEHALGRKLGLQFLERTPQRAFAGFLHVVEHQLVLAASLVQRQPAAREHVQALARNELQP